MIRLLIRSVVICMAGSTLAAAAGAQRITFEQLNGVGVAKPDTARLADADVQVIRATKPCGPDRACVTGFDLRVLRVVLPDSAYGLDVSAIAVVEADNRGRLASPTAEMVVGPYRQEQIRFNVPSLPSGARARIRVPLRLPDEPNDDVVVRASFDRESLSGDRYPANNEASSRKLRVEAPHLVLERVEAATDARPNAHIPLAVTLRNASRTANSWPTGVEVYTSDWCVGGGGGAGGGAKAEVPVPALSPGGTFSFVAMIPTGYGPRHAADCRRMTYRVRIDPEYEHEWASDNGKAKYFDFDVR